MHTPVSLRTLLDSPDPVTRAVPSYIVGTTSTSDFVSHLNFLFAPNRLMLGKGRSRVDGPTK